MKARDVTKLLRGRTIVRVDLNSNGLSNAGMPFQSVVLHLDNGGRLSFDTQEHPQGADYGVTMRIVAQAGAEMIFTDRPGDGRIANEGAR